MRQSYQCLCRVDMQALWDRMPDATVAALPSHLAELTTSSSLLLSFSQCLWTPFYRIYLVKYAYLILPLIQAP